MSCADDNAPYVCSENVQVTLEKLEEVGKILFEWFSKTDKLHPIVSFEKPFSINSNKKSVTT